MAQVEPFVSRLTLERDVDCIVCGYNLRGLASDGVCPECACTVAESLKSRLLAAADQRWVGRVALGNALITGAFAAFCVYVIQSALFWWRVWHIAMLAIGISGVLYFAGAWLLTSRQPGWHFLDSRPHAWSIRLLASLFACGHVVTAVGYAILMSDIAEAAWRWSALAMRFSVVAWWISIPLHGLVFQRIGSLMLRVPSRRLSMQARWLAWCLPAPILLILITTTVFRPGSPWHGTFVPVLIWLLLLVHVWATVVVCLTGRLLYHARPAQSPGR